MYYFRKIIIICSLASFFVLPNDTFSARLFFELSEDNYKPGDSFAADVYIDTEEEQINIVDAKIKFSSELLDFVDFSSGNSILTLWMQEPNFSDSEGAVSFIGGVPGGYQNHKGLLGRIIFKATGSGNARISFLSDSAVFLNDGFGTSAKLDISESVIDVSDMPDKPSKNQWLDEIAKDNTPPEPFDIEIGQDNAVFNGKYFIAFSTTDKQTGIDYYEVKEGYLASERAVSPHPLRNQKLTSKIIVTAIDKAGNQRISILPAKNTPWWKSSLAISLIIAIIIVCVLLVARIARKFIAKSDKN